MCFKSLSRSCFLETSRQVEHTFENSLSAKSGQMSSKATREAVKVAIRLRPMSKNERAKNFEKIIDIDQKQGSAFITNPQNHSKVQFTYDFAFPHNCNQEEIYENTSAPVVDAVLQGINGTIFAYGQTGTGKTYTMDGEVKGDNRGIVPRAFEHIFDYMTANSESHKFSVTITYVEIYNEQIRDLLAEHEHEGSLNIREDPDKGFYIQGVNEKTVKTIDDLFKYQKYGKERRVTRQTNMNDESSRSHSILTLNIETLTMIEGGQHVRKARLNLVDLAGSERVAKTGAEGQGFKEGVSINYALMILGNCISALTSKNRSHIPYRDSSLTKLLRDSLGGNAKTLMIATLGPADYNFSESMSTLRYAENAKKIENKPKVNMDPKDALLMQYQTELEALQAQLKNKGNTDAQLGATEDVIRAREEKLEKQKQMLAEASHMAKEEREALQKQLADKQRELEAEKGKKNQFVGRLQELQKFLVNGSKELMARTQKNDAEINAIREKLKKREEHANKLQKEIEEKKAKKQQMMEQCKTIQDKVQLVSEKFTETVNKYKNLKAKVPEVQKTIQEDREQLANQVDAYNRQLELYSLIIDNFIPECEVKRVRDAAVYDNEKGEWHIGELDKKSLLKKVVHLERPKSGIGCPRPTAAVADKSKKLKSSQDETPKFSLKPTPVESHLKEGPKIIDMEGIEEEIEEAFQDDEGDLMVEIPQELPGISAAALYGNLNIHRQI